jgi:hypothetical protein
VDAGGRAPVRQAYRRCILRRHRRGQTAARLLSQRLFRRRSGIRPLHQLRQLRKRNRRLRHRAVDHRQRPLHLPRAADIANRHVPVRRSQHPGKLHLVEIPRRYQQSFVPSFSTSSTSSIWACRPIPSRDRDSEKSAKPPKPNVKFNSLRRCSSKSPLRGSSAPAVRQIEMAH